MLALSGAPIYAVPGLLHNLHGEFLKIQLRVFSRIE